MDNEYWVIQRNYSMRNLIRILSKLVLLFLLANFSLTGAYAAPEQTVIDDQLEQASQLFSSGDLVQAQQIYMQVLEQFPEQADATYQLGVILVRRDHIAEGVAMIKRAVELEPDRATFHLALASMYEFVDQNDKAIEEYDIVLQLVSEDTEEYQQSLKKRRFLLASEYAKQGDINIAIKQFKQLVADYPDDFMMHYSLGVAYFLMGSLAEAEQSLLRAKKLNSDYVNVYFSLAKLYESTDALYRAYDVLDQLVQLNVSPSHTQQAKLRMRMIEAQLLLDEGNRSDALTVLEEILKIDSANAQALLLAAALYGEQGDILNELKSYEHLLQLVPDDLDVRLKLAERYLMLDQLELAVEQLDVLMVQGGGAVYQQQAEQMLAQIMNTEAGRQLAARQRQREIENYQRVIEQNPDDYAAYFSLARIYYQQQLYEDARAMFERVLELDPTNKNVYVSLGSIMDKLGHYPESIEYYAQALAYDHEEAVVSVLTRTLLIVIAKKAYSDGQLELAEEHISRAIAMDSRDYEARFMAGLVYSAQRRHLNAVDAFQRVVQMVPGHLGARMNLALSYEQLHREEEAIEEYRDLLRYSPSGFMSESANERMRAAEARIRGFSGGAGYSFTYDSNSNLSDANPIDELRTDLSFSLYYRYKASNGLRWRFSTTPVYSTYHRGQFDYLNTASTVMATWLHDEMSFSGGYSRRSSAGLVNSLRSSSSDSYFSEATARLKLRRLLQPHVDDKVLTNVTGRFSYTEFDSTQSLFFGSYTWGAGLSFSQPIAERTVLALGYGFSRVENMHAIGTDYANRSHNINMRVDRGLAAGLAANVAYSATLYNYKNPDSVTTFTSKRRNVAQNLSLGLSYQFHRLLRASTNLTWVQNNSNLPVGFILSAEDVIEGLQSPSLGDYSSVMLTAGLTLTMM